MVIPTPPGTPLSGIDGNGGISITYEHARAESSSQSQPDPIHWDVAWSYRESSYRKLHHQNGIIGTFHVRLVEARNLRRWRWNALALGPVKHLGLSRAHGEVSSFATLWLGFHHPHPKSPLLSGQGGQPRPSLSRSASDVSLDSAVSLESCDATHLFHAQTGRERFRSSTMFESNHPVWPTSQSSDSHNPSKSVFAMKLRKTAAPMDGMRISLIVQMEEELTAAEAWVPVGGGPGPGAGDDDCDGENGARIGRGLLDLTPLCLGDDGMGKEPPGILDTWVDLIPPKSVRTQHHQDQQNITHAASASNNENHPDDPKNLLSDQQSSSQLLAGQVRLLISYEPNGLAPRRGDLVALESFARRPKFQYQPQLHFEDQHDSPFNSRKRDASISSSSILSDSFSALPSSSWSTSRCRPILPSLSPLQVLDARGSHVLIRYRMPDYERRSTTTAYSSVLSSSFGQMKLHRNAVFVIERTNAMDDAVNVAMTPADMVLSTSAGRAAVDVAGPYVEAAGDVLMPALLSAKLVFAAAKTTGMAGMSAAGAAAGAIIEAGDPNRNRRPSRNSRQHRMYG